MRLKLRVTLEKHPPAHGCASQNGVLSCILRMQLRIYQIVAELHLNVATCYLSVAPLTTFMFHIPSNNLKLPRPSQVKYFDHMCLYMLYLAIIVYE